MNAKTGAQSSPVFLFQKIWISSLVLDPALVLVPAPVPAPYNAIQLIGIWLLCMSR